MPDAARSPPMFAGIEAGGTKFVLGVGTAEHGSIATARIATRDPDDTFAEAAAFFAAHARPEGLAAAGFASFGPVELDPRSRHYGRILATPKPGWRDVDVAARTRTMLGVPVALETDVNAAAIAEAAVRDSGDLAYVTVGTGIGVGLVAGGRPVHGRGHPEAGHVLVRRHLGHGGFAGICPFHGDCLEGLASGAAIRAAWGAGLDALASDHPAWAIEADYVAQLCAMLILTLAPAVIVLGGGVMSQQALFPPIRGRTAELLAGYVTESDAAALERRIAPPICVEPPGLLGAYRIAAALVAR